MLVWHCMDVLQCDEHSEHDCRALHHTFTAPCWQAGKNRDFLPALRQVWPSSGGIAACRCYNSTCLALYGCITVHEHSQHDCRALHHTFTAPCRQDSCLRSGKNPDFLPTLRQVWPSSGGMPSCRCYNSRCLALYGCITI